MAKKKPCAVCAPARCRCRDLDRAADEWAKKQGVKLPSERDTGRLLGDSWVTSEQLQALEGKRDNAQEAREYLALIEARILALDHQRRASAAERTRLELQRRVLRMRYDGEGMDERSIARAFGRRSHSWASERLVEIEAEAMARLREVGSVAVRCAKPGCGHAVTRFKGNGRPPRFCSIACRKAHDQRVRRLRLGRERRAKRAVPVQPTPSRWAVVERVGESPQSLVARAQGRQAADRPGSHEARVAPPRKSVESEQLRLFEQPANF